MEDSSINEPKFFSSDELKKLRDLESQQISEVKYHSWVNSAKPNELVELLDFIEFIFIDNQNLVLATSELCDAIEVKDENMSAYAADVALRFNNQIRIRTENMSDFPLWERAIEYPVDEVLLDKTIDDSYYSDKILLRLGPVMIQIDISEKGLVVSENTDHYK